jgi:general stress protein YciG
MSNNEKRDMTVREAGRKGGEAVKRKYGSEYYSKIGRKGGNRSEKTGDGDKPTEVADPTTVGSK